MMTIFCAETIRGSFDDFASAALHTGKRRHLMRSRLQIATPLVIIADSVYPHRKYISEAVKRCFTCEFAKAVQYHDIVTQVTVHQNSQESPVRVAGIFINMDADPAEATITIDMIRRLNDTIPIFAITTDHARVFDQRFASVVIHKEPFSQAEVVAAAHIMKQAFTASH
jgi:hypothetical protein